MAARAGLFNSLAVEARYVGGEPPSQCGSMGSGLDITIFGRRRPTSRHALPPLPILLLRLTTAHTRNQLKGVMYRAINSYRLLIIDEIGYLPMNRE